MDKSITLAEFVGQLESLPPSAQMLLKDFLYENLGHKKTNVGFRVSDALGQLIDMGVLLTVEDACAQLSTFKRNELIELLIAFGSSGFRKNMSLEALVQWCIENIRDDVPVLCSEAIAVTMNPIYEKPKRKVYTYLKRKFDTESYSDPDKEDIQEIPYSAIFSVTVSLEGVGKLTLAFPDDEVTTLLNKYGCNRCENWQK